MNGVDLLSQSSYLRLSRAQTYVHFVDRFLGSVECVLARAQFCCQLLDVLRPLQDGREVVNFRAQPFVGPSDQIRELRSGLKKLDRGSWKIAANSQHTQTMRMLKFKGRIAPFQLLPKLPHPESFSVLANVVEDDDASVRHLGQCGLEIVGYVVEPMAAVDVQKINTPIGH